MKRYLEIGTSKWTITVEVDSCGRCSGWRGLGGWWERRLWQNPATGTVHIKEGDKWEIAGPRSTPEEIISDVLADGFKGSDAARKVLREIEEAGYKITVTEGG